MCFFLYDQIPAYMAMAIDIAPHHYDRYVTQYTYRTPDESSCWVTKMSYVRA